MLAATIAVAQPAPGTHRIGFINSGPPGLNEVNVVAMRKGFADLGYEEGRNLVIDYRWANQQVDRLPMLLDELVALKPEVIISTGGPVTVRAAKNATTTIPVVFVTGDPVEEKLVASYRQPGGNMTGFAVLAADLEAKRLEILTQILPRAKRIAAIWNPESPSIDRAMQNLEAAARRLNLRLTLWKASSRQDLERVFVEIAAARPEALFVVGDPVLGFERARIVEFSNANRLPGIYFWREFAEDGGLASYGTNLPAIYRRLALPVDKILKGRKAGDIPVELPTTFELVVNQKTAKALGIVIPSSILQRADDVIQ